MAGSLDVPTPTNYKGYNSALKTQRILKIPLQKFLPNEKCTSSLIIIGRAPRPLAAGTGKAGTKELPQCALIVSAPGRLLCSLNCSASYVTRRIGGAEERVGGVQPLGTPLATGLPNPPNSFP